MDHLYRIQEASAEFLFKHPQPNTVVVSSASKSRRNHFTPDKEGKKLNSYSRRMYSGALGIKSGNYATGISRFIHAIFEDLDPYLKLILEESRTRALQLCADALAAAKHNITVARHGLETAATTLTTGLALRRHSWLRVTSLMQDTKLTIEDLARASC